MEDEHSNSLKILRTEKEVELRRIETEWEDKITATGLQHKATLESAISDHERTIMNLRHQFQKEVNFFFIYGEIIYERIIFDSKCIGCRKKS